MAPTEATVLLEGPTGAGKELFAQAIHEASARRKQAASWPSIAAPFAKIAGSRSCLATRRVPSPVRMADKKRLIEEANGGTLFLDEIGELELSLQAKLLRVLESQEFIKVGDTKPTRANVRLVAATNRSLKQEAEPGAFPARFVLPPLGVRSGGAAAQRPPRRRAGAGRQLLRYCAGR
ncbi:MAG: sigma 54-interacting transcriptional regulator [Hymenobacter sp.]